MKTFVLTEIPEWLRYGARVAAENGNSTKPPVSGSVFTEDEEKELQRLVRKIKYQQSTYDDMEKADALTRKKWKSQGIG